MLTSINGGVHEVRKVLASIRKRARGDMHVCAWIYEATVAVAQYSPDNNFGLGVSLMLKLPSYAQKQKCLKPGR